MKNAAMARAGCTLQETERDLGACLMRMKSAKMAGAYDRWISNLKETKRQARVLERVVTRMKNGAMFSALGLWLNYVKKEMVNRQIVHNFFCRRMMMRLIKKRLVITVKILKDYTIEEKQMKRKTLKAVQRLMNSALVSSF
jgi:hypothetical protein